MKTNYDWCLETYRASKPFIKQFRTAVDVGCRDGDFTLPLVEDFNNVHAFDFRKRMKFINPKKLEFHQVALGDVNEKVKAFAGVITEYREEKNPVEVEQKKLDDYNLQDVDYIKIDVEGHELKVLKGAITTIESYNPVIVIEENGSQVKWNKGTDNDALNYLLSLGYKVEVKFAKPNPLDIILVR